MGNYSVCSADVSPSHFHRICFPLQSWILLCLEMIKSYRSLVFISLLLLLPNLQFHWPPSLFPVWPPSTDSNDWEFHPRRRIRRGRSGRALCLAGIAFFVRHMNENSFSYGTTCCLIVSLRETICLWLFYFSHFGADVNIAGDQYPRISTLQRERRKEIKGLETPPRVCLIGTP